MSDTLSQLRYVPRGVHSTHDCGISAWIGVESLENNQKRAIQWIFKGSVHTVLAAWD